MSAETLNRSPESRSHIPESAAVLGAAALGAGASVWTVIDSFQPEVDFSTPTLQKVVGAGVALAYTLGATFMSRNSK